MTEPLRASAITWMQEADSNDDKESPQRFKAEVEDAGGGPFIVVSTERWAMSDEAEIDQLAQALKAFLRQAPEDA